ncbi:MAG: hypothetical protein KFW21_01135 [Spirochaetota bacterium]|nr:hypothetical protein [Spirochaetota bacterium]
MYKKIILFIFVMIPSLGFSFFGHDDDLTGWVGYDQQFGILNDKFITYGGASAGVSIFGISLGAAVYGNYGHNVYVSSLPPMSATMIYGGVIIGYKSPEIEFVRFRLNTLLGYGTVELGAHKTGHFVVSPTFYVDFEVFDQVNFSVGVTYRYFHEVDNTIGLNKAENSFAGSISFSWIDN